MTDALKIQLADTSESQALFGPHDHLLKIVEEETEARIVARGTEIAIYGPREEQERLEQLFEALLSLIRKGIAVTERDVRYAAEMARQGKVYELVDLYEVEIGRTYKGQVIRPQTLGQRHYISAIKKHDIVFGIGPAGTGKTFLAVVFAVMALKQNAVKRIVLTRPAVEAGENLGFLPGDLQEKVDPYLRPLYDALYYVLGAEPVTKLIERRTIEIAPLAYMRGRTL
ncbi:MAG: PhoH family protein, partial [Novibacillus thermophilus]